MSQYIPDEYFEKLQKNKLTENDKQLFSEWVSSADPVEVEAIAEKIASYFEEWEDELPLPLPLGNEIERRINEIRPSRIHVLIRRGLAVAAAVAAVAAIFFTYIFFKAKPVDKTEAEIVRIAPIVPGSNKAILTLSNGRSIVLNDAKNGLLASQDRVKVVKTRNGQVIYVGGKQNIDNNNDIAFNTISTPRGGQYQLALPDGSKVWLNSESSLRYPVQFGNGDRRVELTGEAYFEVAKDKTHPFKVSVNNVEVKVLGTHFNIMAYSDEATVKTTLLEGSVQVTRGTNRCTIVPGEQAVVGKDIKVIKVDALDAIEWKNGYFGFAHERLPVIMRSIARWYDVSISYEGEPTTVNFVGSIPRSANIADVLKYLELTGLVHFKINGRRVVVMP